ncbi:MAG: hypothetical protein Q4G02_02375 [bacterium]|nr:hypothetical protein [bacterium]
MKNWKKLALMISVVAGAIILLLLLILGWQKLSARQAANKEAAIQRAAIAEKNQADVLLQEVENLKNLTNDLVIPQVKSNIRL